MQVAFMLLLPKNREDFIVRVTSEQIHEPTLISTMIEVSSINPVDSVLAQYGLVKPIIEVLASTAALHRIDFRRSKDLENNDHFIFTICDQIGDENV